MEKLDDLIEKHNLPSPYFIKIDVEGAELEVLKGAERTLKNTEAVIADASILPKYKGVPELADLVGAMQQYGFSVFDILAGSNHPDSGYLYQVDLVFVKTDSKLRQ